MLFGRIGGGGKGGGDDDDSYLLKTPGRVTAAAAGHESEGSLCSTHSVYSVYVRLIVCIVDRYVPSFLPSHSLCDNLDIQVQFSKLK